MSSDADAICPKCEGNMVFDEDVHRDGFVQFVHFVCSTLFGYEEVVGFSPQDEDPNF